MKYWLILLLIMLFCGTPCSVRSAAPATEFLFSDPVSNRLEVVDSNLKSVVKFNFDSKPLNLKRLPDQRGYLLLLKGVAKIFKTASHSAALVYFDQQLRPTGRRIELPGEVVKEVYFEQANLWLIVTSQAKQTILNLVNPNSGTKRQLELEATPDLLELSPDGNQLALSVPDKQVGATIKLIDFKQARIQSFPVGIFPGALYFGDSGQIFVAGGATRRAPKKLFSLKTSDAATSHAQLITINFESGQNASLPLGEIPVTIIQDQNNPAIFYSLNSISAKQPPSKSPDDSKAPVPAESNSTLRLINGGKETAIIELPGKITQIVQAPSGNICLLGQSRFLLFDPEAAQLIANIGAESKLETISVSPSGKLGYLRSDKGCSLQIIDLLSGKQLKKIESRPPALIDQLQLLDLSPYLFPTNPPAVSGISKTMARQPTAPVNRQVIVDEAQGRIYQLASRKELLISDLQSNQPVNSVKLNDTALGFHLVPHSNLIMAFTKQAWCLIDPQKTAPVLTVKINLSSFDNDRHNRIARNGYYSPDGTHLAIPCNNRIYLVKTDTRQLLGQIKTKAQEPVIFWP
jgi:hypothetical protein